MIFHIYERIVIPGSVVIPIFTALFNYRFLNTQLKIIFAFILFSGIVDFVSIILAEHNIPNLSIFHIYTIFEFAFISWFYKIQFKGIANKIIPVLIIVFAILCIINFIFIQYKIEFNTYTRSVEVIIIIIYCILYFANQSKIDNNYNWSSISLNWINAGILISYSSSLFTFVFSNYLLTAGKQINNIVWGSYGTIVILEYILFAVGFYKCRNQLIIFSSL